MPDELTRAARQAAPARRAHPDHPDRIPHRVRVTRDPRPAARASHIGHAGNRTGTSNGAGRTKIDGHASHNDHADANGDAGRKDRVSRHNRARRHGRTSRGSRADPRADPRVERRAERRNDAGRNDAGRNDAGRGDRAEAARRGRLFGRGSRSRRVLVVVVLLAALAGLWFGRGAWWPAVTSTNPYQTSPAANFPVGAEGIVTPDAAAVEGMTADQVADALNRVKRALEAAYLDPRLLVEHDPTPVLNLLAPDSAATVRQRFAAGEYGTALVQLASGTKLAAEPRSSGRMRYERVDWNGRPALDVTSNYVFAYAFARPSGVVVIHTETHWMFPIGGDIRPSSRGMYLGRTNGYWHGMDCTFAATGRTAPATARSRGTDPDYRESDSLDAYFDPTRPVTVTSGCR